MTKHTQPQLTDVTAMMFAPMAAFNTPFTESFMKSGEVFAKSLQAWPAEFAGFVGKRMLADAKLYSDCVQCTNLEELIVIHQKWLKETGEDYLSEAGQMSALGKAILDETVQAARETAPAPAPKKKAASKSKSAKSAKAAQSDKAPTKAEEPAAAETATPDTDAASA